ncbi:hypothetical protein ISF_06396 [Cordyceps fumosorosea ARSEF 2679]|uniref:Uncharacterized protein n=1 Tax=Cordyceps fumosorosea (strain ARSEF 2679) TaxID=1081104 RepID=A0A167SBR9_CORFA|nr:hypothetical protein ISF_06396 [Cordyceps fumosorosea ARSEF 2679]OAA59461.1 hypothetical protein ISF_06396 [Cordyceps fumosorosea ARSEF 2679]
MKNARHTHTLSNHSRHTSVFQQNNIARMRFVNAALAAATAVLFGSQAVAGLTLDSPTPTTTLLTTTTTPSSAQVTSTTTAAGTGTGAVGFNKTCAHSVYSRAFKGAVSNTELSSVLRSYRSVGSSPHPWQGNLCTVTLAASLSVDYLSYLADAPSRYASATDYLRNVHTDCGGPVFQVSVRPLCLQKSLTAVFTTAGDGGGSGPKTTVLPGVPPSNGVSIDVKTGNVSMINLAANDEDSRAPRSCGLVVGFATVVAAVAGAVLML